MGSMFHRMPAAAAAAGPSEGAADRAAAGGKPQPELMYAERVMQRSGNPYAGVNWRGVFSLPPLSLPVIAGKTYENDSPYLMFYNTIMFFGWLYMFFIATFALVQGWDSRQIYLGTIRHLKVFQTAAILEIAHAAFGLVRAPVLTTGMQVGSRIWVLWGIIGAAPEMCSLSSVPLFRAAGVNVALNFTTLLYAWAITEVIRYFFYAIKEALGEMPFRKLLWARYTAFMPLYPLGVASELTMVWLALPTIERDRPWSVSLPNSFNFAFDYYWLCIILSVIYIPGLPHMYLYMLRQRRKMLSKKLKAEGAVDAASSKKEN